MNFFSSWILFFFFFFFLKTLCEDLNLSFVVDEGQAKDLVAGLHSRLFPTSLEEYAAENAADDQDGR